MPVEVVPLFRPDIVRQYLAGFTIPDAALALQARLEDWSALLATSHGAAYKETELLADFLTHVFIGGLGYTPPGGAGTRCWTIRRCVKRGWRRPG